MCVADAVTRVGRKTCPPAQIQEENDMADRMEGIMPSQSGLTELEFRQTAMKKRPGASTRPFRFDGATISLSKA